MSSLDAQISLAAAAVLFIILGVAALSAGYAYWFMWIIVAYHLNRWRLSIRYYPFTIIPDGGIPWWRVW